MAIPNEYIWTIPRAILESLGKFQGVCLNPERYLPELLHPQNARFLHRPLAENDPSHKQLIPYCVLTFEDKILRYYRARSGGESRLHNLGSIGIGGHINLTDLQNQEPNSEAYYRALYRELEEEVEIADGIQSEQIIALLNDDSNLVGQVHLGIVHRFTLKSPRVIAREDHLHQLEFLSLPKLQLELTQLETWSQLIVQNWQTLMNN